MSRIDWDKELASAHEHSWPTVSVCIQNVNPSPSQGGRNIFQDEEKEILVAAIKHGFTLRMGKICTLIKL